MYRVWNYVSNYSLLLIGGAALALAWANVAPDSYHAFVDYPLVQNFLIGQAEYEGGTLSRTLTVHFLINDVLMALFFAIAAKEVWEAIILEEGSLRGRKAMTPLIATAGAACTAETSGAAAAGRASLKPHDAQNLLFPGFG